MRRFRFIVGDLVLSIAGAVTSVALRIYPDEVVPPDLSVGKRHPFFREAASVDEMTDGEWAGLIVLHAEAVHGCDHTGQARAGIGMAGPRVRVIES